jgi:hypothetical protein
MAIVGVLAYPFSLREGQEPSLSNVKLAEETIRICNELKAQRHEVRLVPSWEVKEALVHLRKKSLVYHFIDQLKGGKYLGTKEMFEAALPILEQAHISRLVVVANPFLHLQYARWLARRHFLVVKMKIRWIGFDKHSDQWWCRSWWQLTVYLVGSLFGRHGFNGRQAKT